MSQGRGCKALGRGKGAGIKGGRKKRRKVQ